MAEKSNTGRHKEESYRIAETGPVAEHSSTTQYGIEMKQEANFSTPTARPVAPPNRFGIKAGPRWDGVDRGNGFEDKLAAMQSRQVRADDDRYRASVADW